MKQEISLTYQDCAEVEYTEEVKRTLTAKSIANHLPELPIELFLQITTWLSDLSRINNVEGVCSLTVKDGQWVPIIWHQTAHGALNVQYQEDSPENTELVESLDVVDELKKIHCTIHSHNKAPAGQSSDDKDDECSKMGWHITVGNCDRVEFSLHARFCVFANAVFVDGVKTASAHQEFINVEPDIICNEIKAHSDIPSYMLKSTLEVMHTSSDTDYPAEWMDRCYKEEPAKWHQYASYHKKKTTPQNGLTHTDMINITDTETSVVDMLCDNIKDECRGIDIFDVLTDNLALQYTYAEDVYADEELWECVVMGACNDAYDATIKHINATYSKKKRKKKIMKLAEPNMIHSSLCDIVEQMTMYPSPTRGNDYIINTLKNLIKDPWN